MEEPTLEGKTRLYPIGLAAELLEVHAQTLRHYEEMGLLHPIRRNGRRYYSDDDLQWVQCVRQLIHDEKLSVEGVRRLLKYEECWQIKRCGRGPKGHCRGHGHGRRARVENEPQTNDSSPPPNDE